MSNLTVLILQALVGAGKSKLAGSLAAELDANIHSSDSYVNPETGQGLYSDNAETGRIDFNVMDLGKAHGASMKGAAEDIRAGRSVVIDNTNLSASEMAFYVGLAQAYGAAPVIVRVNADPETAFARQTHGVPYAVIRNSETEEIRKTYTFGDAETGENETVVGGFVEMQSRLAAFAPEPHWQWLPGFETREVQN